MTTPAPPGPTEQVQPRDTGGLIVLIALVVLLGVWGGLPAIAIVAGLVVMIFLHELGHYLTAKWAGMKVTEFFLGFGPKLWSFRKGETEYGVKAIPAGAYVKIIGMSNLDEVDPSDEGRTYRAKPFWRRMSVALAGSTMHFLQAFVIMWVILALVGFPTRDATKWTVRDAQGPAAAAGIEVGDKIVSIDGQPVSEFQDLADVVRPRGGEQVEIVVLRHGDRVPLTATLAETNPDTGERRGFLGVGPKYAQERENVLVAIPRSAGEVVRGIGMSITGLRDLFSPSGLTKYVDQVSGRVDPGSGEGRVTSVVGVVKAATDTPGGRDWTFLLSLLFMVNVFVGVFNLTPLLPFDGGHAVIAIYEKIRSRMAGREYRADVAKLMPLTYVVILVLGLLMVTSVYMDIARPLEL